MKAEAKAVRTAAARQDRTETSQPTLTLDDIETLKAPFEKDRLGVKVQSFNKDRSRAMLVLYLQHTDVQDRIEQVDPAWSSEIISEERVGDTVYVRTRMTIKGVSRENVGEGGDPKAAYSDALKRSAMLFGIGRYLYDSETVWTAYDDARDRFRQWSVDDYEAALGKSTARAKGSVTASAPVAKPSATAKASPTKSVQKSPEKSEETQPGLKTKVSHRSRDQLNRILMSLYRPYLTKYPDTRFVELLQSRYKVGETRLMTIEQIEDLVQFMETRLREVA